MTGVLLAALVGGVVALAVGVPLLCAWDRASFARYKKQTFRDRVRDSSLFDVYGLLPSGSTGEGDPPVSVGIAFGVPLAEANRYAQTAIPTHASVRIVPAMTSCLFTAGD